MYNQVWYKLITWWLANSLTTRTVHWRARTTNAPNSVDWRLHIHRLIPWSS